MDEAAINPAANPVEFLRKLRRETSVGIFIGVNRLKPEEWWGRAAAGYTGPKDRSGESTRTDSRMAIPVMGYWIYPNRRGSEIAVGGECRETRVMLGLKLCRTVQRFNGLKAALTLLGILATVATAEPPREMRILFLGDSITYQGSYVSIIEAALITQYPDNNYRVINLGLGSETVSGLSEEGHAGGRFPRPDLNERLDRALAQNGPDLVIACYGMNDGIYLPLADDRFAAFRQGMIWLRAKVIAAGANIIHLTPPVFDPAPIPDRVKSVDGKPAKFYGGYNDVLGTYAAWLME